MKSYDTLVEAVSDLRQRGYTEDFNIKTNHVECAALAPQLNPEEFTIEEFYRFEGFSDPDDNSIVYAISSAQGFKGILVDAYGTYSEKLDSAMVKKLKVNYNF